MSLLVQLRSTVEGKKVILNNYCNFQLFASNIKGNTVATTKICRNWWLAKRFNEPKHSLQNFKFFRENFSETIYFDNYQAQIFTDN